MYILNLHIPPFWKIVSHSFISFHSLLCVSQFFIDFGSHCHMPILSVDLECFLGFIFRPFFWLVLYSGRHIFTIQEFSGMYYSVSPCGLYLFFRTAASPRISLRKYIRIYFKCVPCPLYNVFSPSSLCHICSLGVFPCCDSTNRPGEDVTSSVSLFEVKIFF